MGLVPVQFAKGSAEGHKCLHVLQTRGGEGAMLFWGPSPRSRTDLQSVKIPSRGTPPLLLSCPPHPWPGDPAFSPPGQFWILTRGPGDWAWGGIHQLITYLRESEVTLPTTSSPGRLCCTLAMLTWTDLIAFAPDFLVHKSRIEWQRPPCW